MRINIKTSKPIKDPDLRALYLFEEAKKESTCLRMLKANLDFFLGRMGLRAIPK